MRWWKRIIFSIVSLVLGFCSLDYLFYAFRLLVKDRNTVGNYELQRDGLLQLLGAFLFLLWFVVLIFYFYLIRNSSNQIDLIETKKDKKEKYIRGKRFDLLLQGGLLITGLILRWCYLILIYLPGR